MRLNLGWNSTRWNSSAAEFLERKEGVNLEIIFKPRGNYGL